MQLFLYFGGRRFSDINCVKVNNDSITENGDLKVWDLTWHKAVHSFPGEHARHGLFKNISQGVAQVEI